MSSSRRVFVVGGTGTIGRATVRALSEQGHAVVCLVRPTASAEQVAVLRGMAGVRVRAGDVAQEASLRNDGLCGEPFDAVVSCLASRTGAPRDAWAIDHHAHQALLRVAQSAGVPQMIVLSAICVQKPLLAFQQAKLAFERELMASGLNWSIVRPTAFFKSLSGQVARVQRGKPFVVFGNGELTSCKPISDRDLAAYIVGCLDDVAQHHRILPIGGPGDALTPKQQGALLFEVLGREPMYKHVPVAMMDGIITVLSTLGRVIPPLEEKAQLARIGRYYATESMLVWDAAMQRYDAAATPSTGADTLAEYFAQRVRGEVGDDRGSHAVFGG
ncbi:MAG: NAD(P)H-binding protein [Gemmatimonadaceae bacterium]|nr:NAD(P)H-binding protein [Gemmatimonadaceae bacterium]